METSVTNLINLITGFGIVWKIATVVFVISIIRSQVVAVWTRSFLFACTTKFTNWRMLVRNKETCDDKKIKYLEIIKNNAELIKEIKSFNELSRNGHLPTNQDVKSIHTKMNQNTKDINGYESTYNLSFVEILEAEYKEAKENIKIKTK